MDLLIEWLRTFAPLFQLVIAVTASVGLGAYLLRWAWIQVVSATP